MSNSFCNFMMRHVKRSAHNQKILNSIIRRIVVYMVDNLIGVKLSANMFFHKVAVLKNLLSVNCNNFVTNSSNRSCAINSRLTFKRIAISFPHTIMLRAPSLFGLSKFIAFRYRTFCSHINYYSFIKDNKQYKSHMAFGGF